MAVDRLPRLTRALLSAAAVLVPRDRRTDWRAEWTAELWALHDRRGLDGSPRSPALVPFLCRGAIPHAMSLRAIDWSHLMHDIRYALRLITRQRSFAAAAIATLALGIGGSTAVFSVADTVLVKPLAYKDPGRLVWMFGAFKLNDSAAVSPPDFVDYRQQNDAFASLGAMAIGLSTATVPASDGPVRLQVSRVSAGLLDTLGAQMIAGRDFVPDDEREGNGAVIVSERLAVERFGSGAASLGQPLTVDGTALVIVGVTPTSFVLPYDSFIRVSGAVDLYVPLVLDSSEARIRRFHSLRLIGRLKPGATVASAQSNMDVIARQLEAAYPENETWRLRLVPLHERIVANVRPVLLMLMAAVTLVLVIACVNVAGLLVARANTRDAEMAIRGALGASRRRVIRQLLVEGLVLSSAGATAGLGVAWLAISVLKTIGPADLPRLQEIGIDPRTIGFAFVSGIGTTLLFALLPAIAASRTDLTTAARSASRASAGRDRLRRTLVTGQIALSVLLLVVSGLLTRSFARLVSIDPGFVTDDVLLAQVILPERRYTPVEKADAFFDALLGGLGAMPGIEAVAASTAPPLAGASDTAIHPDGQPPATPSDRQFAQVRWIQGRYFHLLGIPIVAGRSFDDRVERPGAPLAVVISRNVADQFFPDTNPIGRRLTIDLGRPAAAEVIGIAADARLFGQGSAAPPTIYLSARQDPGTSMHVVVRSALDGGQFTRTLRAAIGEIDPTLAPAQVHTMRSLVDRSIAQPRFRMLLIGVFAVVALMLTLVGLYGTVSYSVSQRRREIGIRLAVGADGRQVVKMIVRQAAWMLAIGVAAGLGAAVVAGRAMSNQLFDVEPTDPLVFLTVPLVLTLVALAAILGPSRAAARVDPVIALRAE